MSFWRKIFRLPIRLFWFQHPNFGDTFSPFLCQYLSGRSVRFTRDWAHCDLLAVGSILQLVRPHLFRGAIWGTGFIEDPGRPVPFPYARIAAVRGRLTRQILQADPATPLGDPGLLAYRFARPQPKRYPLGLAPHYIDMDHPLVRTLLHNDPHIHLIDICAGIDRVLAEIAQCRAIISSGLHALVIADALQIPNAWIVLSDKVLGAGFKFRDYYSAFGIDQVQPLPLFPTDTADSILARLPAWSRPGLVEIQRRLEEVFPE